MWFLLIAHYSKIDLRNFLSMYWLLSAFLVYFTVYKISKSKIIPLLSFAFYALHPVALFVIIRVTIYRNLIYLPTLAIFLSLIILFYHYMMNDSNIKSIIVGTILGIVFTFIYLLTETGIVFLGVLYGFLFVILFLVAVKYLLKKEVLKERIKYFAKKIAILIIPIVVGIFGITIYKFVNYRVFGAYVVNMRTEGETARLISNIQDIESEEIEEKYVWCNEEQINKAYKASKTFQTTKNLYYHLRTERLGAVKGSYNYQGDFLGWSLMTYIKKYNISYADAIECFKNISQELEEAFKNGSLTKTNKIKVTKTLGRYSVDEIKNEIIPLFFSARHDLNFLQGLELYLNGFSDGFVDETGKYMEFFNISDKKPVGDYTKMSSSLLRMYKLISKMIYYLTIFNLFIAIVFFVFEVAIRLTKKYEKYYEYVCVDKNSLLIAISFYVVGTVYIFSICLFVSWMFKQLEEYDIGLLYYYAAMYIPYMFFAFIFSYLAIKQNIIKGIKVFKERYSLDLPF